jgi:hypothetical protein
LIILNPKITTVKQIVRTDLGFVLTYCSSFLVENFDSAAHIGMIAFLLWAMGYVVMIMLIAALNNVKPSFSSFFITE